MLVLAWDALLTQTIVNCFQKSGISTESQETATAEGDDPFWELQDEIDVLRCVLPELSVMIRRMASVMTMIIIPVKLLMNQ